MEGDRGTGGNVSDVDVAFPEPPEKHLQVQSPTDDKEEKEDGNVSDDPSIVLHLEIEAPPREDLDLQQMMASTITDLIRKSLEAENLRAEANKALEDQQHVLKDRDRDITGRMTELKMEKKSQAANFLKEEGKLRLAAEKLNFEVEKARVALNEKEDAVALIREELFENEVKIAEEKELLTSFEGRQRILTMRNVQLRAIRREIVRLAREVSEQALENEKKSEAVRKEGEKLEFEKKMYEKWKDEKLNRLRGRKSNYEDWIQGILLGDMDVQEEVIASLMEELGIQPEKWRNAFDFHMSNLIAKRPLAAAMKEAQDFLKSSKRQCMISEEMRAAKKKPREETLKKIIDHHSGNNVLMEMILSEDNNDGILQFCLRHLMPRNVLETFVLGMIIVAVTFNFLNFASPRGQLAKDLSNLPANFHKVFNFMRFILSEKVLARIMIH